MKFQCEECGEMIPDGHGLSCAKPERKRIKFFSMGEKKNGLYDLKFMEGGSYISDWVHSLPHSWRIQRTAIPEKVAALILGQLELGSVREFGNKDFVRITGEGDVAGVNDRELVTFLYKHDFTWYIYNLE